MKARIVLALTVGMISIGIFMGIAAHDRRIVPEKVPEAPKVLLPFSYGERHITDWSGLFGGATPDAKPVKTVVIPGPAK